MRKGGKDRNADFSQPQCGFLSKRPHDTFGYWLRSKQVTSTKATAMSGTATPPWHVPSVRGSTAPRLNRHEAGHETPAAQPDATPVRTGARMMTHSAPGFISDVGQCRLAYLHVLHLNWLAVLVRSNHVLQHLISCLLELQGIDEPVVIHFVLVRSKLTYKRGRSFLYGEAPLCWHEAEPRKALASGRLRKRFSRRRCN